MDDAEVERTIALVSGGDRDAFEVNAVALTKRGLAEALCSGLGAAHRVSLDLFAQLNAWPDAGIRVAVRRLMPAVAKVTALKLTEAVQFLKFAERVPLSHRHTAVEQLQPHVAVDPELGRQLGDAQLHGDVTGEGALRTWAGAFAVGAPAAAATYAAKLLNFAVGPADAQLQALLLYLDMKQAEVVAVLEPVEARLTARLLAGTRDPDRGEPAWMALTATTAFSGSAMAALQRGLEEGEIPALVAAAHWLQTRASAKVGVTAVPIEDLARTMLRHAVEKDDVRRAVDSATSSLMYRDSTRPLILPCVADLGSLDEDIAELFPETLSALCEHQPDFMTLLTRWLLAPDATFTALRSLLSRCTAGQAPTGLDTVMFAAASPDRKVVAARRLLGLTHNGPVLCRFISVLAESPALQPDGLNMAAQMLNEAFEEYPNATVAFLQGRTRPSERKAPFSHVYRGVYANALRWRRVLARLPRLNELRPTDSQLHALRAMQSRMNREILRVANEHSIFAALATKMNIVQGRRFVVRTERGLTAISAMEQASHAVELPSSELADPVGGMLRRARRLGGSR